MQVLCAANIWDDLLRQKFTSSPCCWPLNIAGCICFMHPYGLFQNIDYCVAHQEHVQPTDASSPALQLPLPEVDAGSGGYTGPIFAVSRPEQPHSDAACVTFVPALMVDNALPCPVDVSISTLLPVPARDQSALCAGQSTLQLGIAAGQQEALPATCIMGETISWAIGSSPAHSSNLVTTPSAAQIPPVSTPVNVRSPNTPSVTTHISPLTQAPALSWSSPFSTAGSRLPHAPATTIGSVFHSASDQQMGTGRRTAVVPLPQPGSSCSLQLALPPAPCWLDKTCSPRSPHAKSQVRAQHKPGHSMTYAACILVCIPATALPESSSQPSGARPTTTGSSPTSPAHRATAGGCQPQVLTLLPHAAVINGSPWWVRLEVPGAACPGPWVAPGQGLPMDWHPLRFRPRKVALMAAVPDLSSSGSLESAQQLAPHFLRCPPFKVGGCLMQSMPSVLQGLLACSLACLKWWICFHSIFAALLRLAGTDDPPLIYIAVSEQLMLSGSFSWMVVQGIVGSAQR